MKLIGRFCWILFAFVLLFACTQEEDQVLLDQVAEQALTTDQQQALNYYDETALLLTELSQDQTVRDEILGVVLLNYEMTSAALFKHLLDPASMPVPGGINQRVGNSEFARQFRSLAGNKQYPKNTRTSAKQPRIPANKLEKYLLDNDVEIYWPYWQETASLKEPPTITYDPITNEDVNVGYRRNKDGSVDTVQIDDNYAYEHPTWIVMQHQSIRANSPVAQSFSPDMNDLEDRGLVNLIPIDCERDPDCPFNPNPTPKPKPKPIVRPDGSHKYNKLYVYDVKLNGNFRGLFGGDNDVDFYMADEGVLNFKASTTDNLVVDDGKYNLASTRIDRYAGRNGKWRRPNVVLDNNWNAVAIEPVFGVIGRQVKSAGLQLKGSIGISASIGLAGPSVGPVLKVDWKFPKADRAISVLSYEREQFFLENWRNADGYGTYRGRAVRRAGSGERKTVYYTYRVNAYNN